MVASCTPCVSSATVSFSGQRVAAMRRRRSTSASSGTSTRKGRIAVSSATAVAAPAMLLVVSAPRVRTLLRSTDGCCQQRHGLRDRPSAASPESPRRRAYTTSWDLFHGCQILIYLCTADHGSLTRLPLDASAKHHARARSGASLNLLFAQRLEGGAQLLAEDLGLFPGREVAALVNLVPVDEVAEIALAPTLRRPIDLGRKHGDRDRELRDVDGVERAAASLRSFPVGPR